MTTARPTGQSEAWNRGLDWAYDIGPHHELGIIEACDAWGYDFDSAEADQFERGASYGLHERYEA